MTVTPFASRGIAIRLMLLDAASWVTAIFVVTAVARGRVAPVAGASLIGAATLIQIAAGAAHGLYGTRRIYESLWSEAHAIGIVAAATTAILVAANWLFTLYAGSPLDIPVAGFLAFLLMVVSRAVRRAIYRPRHTGKKDAIQLDVALPVGERLIAQLEACDAVSQCSLVGSLRRLRESVNDIDIVVAGEPVEEAVDRIRALPGLGKVTRVRGEGEPKLTLYTPEEIKAEITVVSPSVYGAALMNRSGSKAHDRKIRKVALRKGFKFAPGPRDKNYWLYRLTSKNAASPESHSEHAIYRRLGMQWIPPVLREDRGEVEAALEQRLPQIVDKGDIRGDLHSGPLSLDKVDAFRQLLTAAMAQGNAYFAVTLPARALEGKDVQALRGWIRKMRAAFSGRLEVLEALEWPIPANPALDIPDEILGTFDLVVATSRGAGTSPESTTRELLAAIESPRVNMVAIDMGGATQADFAAIFQAAKASSTIIEIGGGPSDISDQLVFEARKIGARLAVSARASAPGDLAKLRYALAKAQRGWATPDDVVNAWPLPRVRQMLLKSIT